MSDAPMDRDAYEDLRIIREATDELVALSALVVRVASRQLSRVQPPLRLLPPVVDQAGPPARSRHRPPALYLVPDPA